MRSVSTAYLNDELIVLSFMSIFISTWVLLVAGLVFALPMIFFRVRDHTELSDEVLWVHVYPLLDCIDDIGLCSCPLPISTRMDDFGNIQENLEQRGQRKEYFGGNHLRGPSL